MAFALLFEIFIRKSKGSDNPLIASKTDASPRDTIRWIPGDHFKLRVHLLNEPEQPQQPFIGAQINSGNEIVLNGKNPEALTGDSYFSATGFTEVESGGQYYYEADLDLNVEAFITAANEGNGGKANVMAELQVQDAGNTKRLSYEFPVIGKARVYQGTEGVPTSGDPAYPVPGAIVTLHPIARDFMAATWGNIAVALRVSEFIYGLEGMGLLDDCVVLPLLRTIQNIPTNGGGLQQTSFKGFCGNNMKSQNAGSNIFTATLNPVGMDGYYSASDNRILISNPGATIDTPFAVSGVTPSFFYVAQPVAYSAFAKPWFTSLNSSGTGRHCAIYTSTTSNRFLAKLFDVDANEIASGNLYATGVTGGAMHAFYLQLADDNDGVIFLDGRLLAAVNDSSGTSVFWSSGDAPTFGFRLENDGSGINGQYGVNLEMMAMFGDNALPSINSVADANLFQQLYKQTLGKNGVSVLP